MLRSERVQVAQGAPAEPEAEYRNAFLRAAAYLRISRQEARTLVELLSGFYGHAKPSDSDSSEH